MTKYNELNISANKGIKRVGRGISSGQGKTAGRGTKGQKARTGKKLRPMFAGGSGSLARRVPKMKGFKSLKTPAQVVYLDRLNELKGTVNNFTLYEAGYIASPYQAVKVIKRGELSSKINLEVYAASDSAKSALVGAGGTFTKTAVPLKKSAEKETE
ncbi:50S ribosomal protein L15 [Candidatus Saccharibacteria bacterium]|nr:50S ribosomal protein L15 [Candidatus Saccharibacteria bacterium]